MRGSDDRLARGEGMVHDLPPSATTIAGTTPAKAGAQLEGLK